MVGKMPDISKSRQNAHDDRLQAHKISDTEYIVYNVKKGTRYSVLKNANGVWSCGCPWNVKGSRLREGNCKHLVRVYDKENGCGSCGRNDEYAQLTRVVVDGPLFCRSCIVSARMA